MGLHSYQDTIHNEPKLPLEALAGEASGHSASSHKHSLSEVQYRSNQVNFQEYVGGAEGQNGIS